MKRRWPVLFLLVVFTSGCALLPSDEERKADLIPSVMQVSSKVNALVRPGRTQADGEELVAEAVAMNRAVLAPLEGYYVTARREGKWSSVLVCEFDRTRALYEDAGCTAVKYDGTDLPEGRPCAFRLKLAEVCAR